MDAPKSEDSGVEYTLVNESMEAGVTPARPTGLRGLSKRAKYGLGTALVVVVTVGIILGVMHNKLTGDDGAAQDNKQTQKLYTQIIADIEAQHVATLNSDLIGDNGVATLQTALGASTLLVTKASAALVTANTTNDSGREHILVTGLSTMFDRTTNVTLDMHYHYGELVMFMRAEDISSDPDLPVPLPTVLPGEIPASYGDIYVNHVVYIVSSHNGTDPVSGQPISNGLSLNCQTNVTNKTVTNQAIQTMNALVQAGSMIPGTIISALVNITGLIRPYVHLNSTSPVGVQYHLGDYVTVENVTVDINPILLSAVVGAFMTVSPPQVEPILATVGGSVSFTDKTLFIWGNQQGNWTIPGNVPHLTLSQGSVNATWVFGDPKNATHKVCELSGAFQANVTYGSLSGFIYVAFPVKTTNEGNFALEAIINDSFNFNALPLIGNSFPETVSESAAFVFSPFTGTYNFHSAAAPAPSMPVVYGFNLFARVNLNSSIGLAPVYNLQRAPSSIVMGASVGAKDDKMQFFAQVQNVYFNEDFNVTKANITVRNWEPRLQLGATVDVARGLLFSNNSVTFDMFGAFGSDLSLVVRGNVSQDGWSTRIGSEDFAVDSFALQLGIQPHTHNHSFSINGSFTGIIDVEKHVFRLIISYPGSYLETKDCPNFELDSVSNVTASDVLDLFLPGHSSLNGGSFGVADDVMKDMVGTTLNDIEFFFSPGCQNFSLEGSFHTAKFGDNAKFGLIVHESCVNVSKPALHAVRAPHHAGPLLLADAPAFPGEKVLAVSNEANKEFTIDRRGVIQVHEHHQRIRRVLQQKHTAPALSASTNHLAFSRPAVVPCRVYSLANPLYPVAAPSASWQWNCTWKWHLFFTPPDSWNFSLSSLVPSDFPKLAITLPTFILSSADDNVTLPVIPGRFAAPAVVTVKQGLNVRAVLLINESNYMSVVRDLNPGIDRLDLIGLFSQSVVRLTATLEPNQNLDLGHDVIFNKASLTIEGRSSGSGAISLSGELTVPDPFDNTNQIVFDAGVSLDTGSQTITFDAAMKDANSSLGVRLGHSDFVINSLSAELVVAVGGAKDPKTNATSTALTGFIKGDMQIGRGHLTAELDLLKGNIVKFTATMVENPPLTFGEMVDSIAGPSVLSSLTLPSSVANDIRNSWAFNSLSVSFCTSPLSVSATGVMTLFGMESLDIVLSLSEPGQSSPTGASANFLLAIDIGLNTKFSSIIPSISSLDSYHFGDIAVGISSYATNVTFPNMTIPYQVLPGFNFYASLNFNGSQALRTVEKWTGIQQAIVRGNIQDEMDFSIHCGIQGDIDIFGIADITAAGFFLAVKGADAQVGLECSSMVRVSPLPQDQLHLYGAAFIGTLGVGVDVAMTTDWVNPFGINGLRLSQCEMEVEVSYELVPVSAGIGGGLFIGDVGGKGDVYYDDTGIVLYGELDNINLQKIVDNILGLFHITPPGLVNTIFDISFKQLKLYSNTGAHTLVFNGMTFPPGFMFDIEQLNMWEIIKGSAMLALYTQPTPGVLLNATLAPINLLNGLIVLSGAHSSNDPAILYLQMMQGQAYPYVRIDAGINLFNEYLACDVQITDQNFAIYVGMSLFNDLFKFSLNCSCVGPPSAPTDFSVSADLNNEIFDYLENEIPKKISASESAVDKTLEAAQQTVASKQADLQVLDDEIAKFESQDEQALDEAQAKLLSAQLDLERAQQHVDSLQSQIDDLKRKIDRLPWYLKWEAVGYGTAIAALYVAKETATGALDLAKLAVEAAAKAVSILPVVDPRIVALKVAHGTAQAALDAAVAILKATEDVYDGIMDMAKEVVTWPGKILNLEQLHIDSSLSDIKRGDLANLHVKGTFFEHNVDITVSIDLTSLESMTEAIWHELVKLFAHKTTLQMKTWPPTHID